MKKELNKKIFHEYLVCINPLFVK
ncbi:hypothetical protein BDFB_014007 [Asbolus verrucosus]|uniref:Uncharacterized protein n=1 Tax=Asbolus verrucosus TaxID=1661398 RepID=A0A482VPY3_ASBVE|nr:hypothetical protein BDFB_014007 [Asbolus verrucosus]